MGIKDCIENSIRTYKLLMEQPEHEKYLYNTKLRK